MARSRDLYEDRNANTYGGPRILISSCPRHGYTGLRPQVALTQSRTAWLRMKFCNPVLGSVKPGPFKGMQKLLFWL